MSGSRDRTLVLWDLDSGEEVCRFSTDSEVRAIAMTADAKYAISISFGDTMDLWDLRSRKRCSRFTADASLSSCAINGDGSIVVLGDEIGSVHFLAIEAG